MATHFIVLLKQFRSRTLDLSKVETDAAFFRERRHLSLAKHNFTESKIDGASAECFIRNKPKEETNRTKEKTVLKIVSLEHEALK